MADWDAEIHDVTHAGRVQPGEPATVLADVEVDTPFFWNELNTDSCSRPYLLVGVDVSVIILIDGVEYGRDSYCMAQDSRRSFSVPFDAPSTEGVYSLTVEVRGSNTGHLENSYSSTLEVLETTEPEPEFDVSVSAPSNVDMMEEFSVSAMATCNGGDCPSASWELVVADESIDNGTVDLGEGETLEVSAGPSEFWINEPGSHTVRFTIGDTTETTQIDVNDVDPPYNPLGGDGPKLPGGSGLPLAALAVAGAVALSESDERETDPVVDNE